MILWILVNRLFLIVVKNWPFLEVSQHLQWEQEVRMPTWFGTQHHGINEKTKLFLTLLSMTLFSGK